MIYWPYHDSAWDISSNTAFRPGYIWPYIPHLVLIRIQYILVYLQSSAVYYSAVQCSALPVQAVYIVQFNIMYNNIMHCNAVLQYYSLYLYLQIWSWGESRIYIPCPFFEDLKKNHVFALLFDSLSWKITFPSLSSFWLWSSLIFAIPMSTRVIWFFARFLGRKAKTYMKLLIIGLGFYPLSIK